MIDRETELTEALRAANAECKKLRAQNEAMRKLLFECSDVMGGIFPTRPKVEILRDIARLDAALQDEQAAP